MPEPTAGSGDSDMSAERAVGSLIPVSFVFAEDRHP